MKAHGAGDDDRTNCPGRDELAAYNLGKLDDESLQRVGGVGVFFGYQSFEDGEGPGWRFQRLELLPNPGQDREAFPFLIKRSLVTVRQAPHGRRPTQEESLGMTLIEQMPRAEQRLEITVRGTRLLPVRWRGSDLYGLCTLEANAGFTRQDYFGEFGLYFHAGDAVFSHASITML